MDIPGYRLERELAPGANRQVWLAWHQASDRAFVLKIPAREAGGAASPRGGIAAPPTGELRELRHRNIAQVEGRLESGSTPVLAVEYISGGNLQERLRVGMRAGELARVIGALGAALDHAHGRGFVHLDIRPENVLFRQDGSAVLTDFGSGWRTADGPPPAQFAARAGAPGFMSPEQAGGGAVDHTSDLYSLGAVVYHALTGEVPQQAAGSTAASDGRPAERVPRLPAHLSGLQAVVDRALARNPEQRFARGAELAEALGEALRLPPLAESTFRSLAVSVEEIRAVTGGLFSAPVDAARQEQRSRRRSRFASRTLSLLALVVLTGAGGIYLVNTQPLWFNVLLAEAGLAENPMLRTAWLDAQSLHQDSNQSLSAIVAGYRRVLGVDAGHAEAQAAIQELAEQWRAAVVESLLQNDIARAEARLEEVSAVFPDHVALADLERQLTDRKTAAALLETTGALLASHGLSDVPSATAAIQAYHEVLRLAPGHPVAQQELDALGEHYAGLAREAAARGDVQDAISFLERATAASGDTPLLSAVRGEIQQATTAQAAIEELLQQARAYRVQGHLVTPPGENAAEFYNRVLATAPDNALARQGLSEVISQLLSQATRMLERDEIAAVGSLIDQASAAGIEAEPLLEIKTRLQDRMAALTMVATNLREAERRLAQGFVTEPPEQNAVSLLREVERLDPDNERAEALLAGAAARLVEVAMDAHSVGLEEEAKQYLELALTVTPDVPAWRALRESWE